MHNNSVERAVQLHFSLTCQHLMYFSLNKCRVNNKRSLTAATKVAAMTVGTVQHILTYILTYIELCTQ